MPKVTLDLNVVVNLMVDPFRWQCRICRPAHTTRRTRDLATAIVQAESHLTIVHDAEIV
jgi:hypothetical protein